VETRDLLMGLFNAFGSYVQRQTGETFGLCIKDREGNIHHIYPSTDLVTWFNAQGEVVPPHVGQPGYAEMRCPLHEGRHDIEKEPLLIELHSARSSH
jgi:hypothetical protein